MPRIGDKFYKDYRYCHKDNRNTLEINGRLYKNVSIDHFEQQCPKILGHSSNSHVEHHQHKKSGKHMALKRTMTAHNAQDLGIRCSGAIRDFELLRKLNGHHNIIRLYGYFEIPGEAVVCMEKMDICFHNLIQKMLLKNRYFPTKVVATLCSSVANALVFLKENEMIHRDIKPANILLNCGGYIKLSDFDGSGYLYDSFSFSDPKRTSCYAAPERIDNDGKPTNKMDCTADVWSLGITTIEVTTLKNPYLTAADHKSSSQFGLMQRILEEDPPKLEHTDTGYDKLLADFVAECLPKKPAQRLYLSMKRGRKYILKHSLFHSDNMKIMKPGEVSKWYENINNEQSADTSTIISNLID